MFINTLEGVHHVSVGDYIIRGVAGEIYPCKPDIFEQTYEEVGRVGMIISYLEYLEIPPRHWHSFFYDSQDNR